MPPSSTKERDSHDVLEEFITKYLNDSDPANIVISRKALLQSTLRAVERKSFSFFKPLTVTFSGEDAIDAGLPKREFFRLLMESVKATGIFSAGWFTHDLDLLRNNKYEAAGKLTAWSVLQGCKGVCCLSPEPYFVLQNSQYTQEKAIPVVSDDKLKGILWDIQKCNEQDFPEVILKHADDIAGYGY